MSTLQDLQPPPPVTILQQSYNSHSAHGSIGPVIGVLVGIILLSILAAMIGRLCTGRRIMGYGQYDIESWIERRCSPCIDGRINSPPPPPPQRSNASMPSPISVQTQQETKLEE
ncbi:hypothetical protein CFOL_v3_12524 [Cephalotus follicularis]|uniref:Uncharacterized protein n=1 Tax=Cephalotus follicularis TaxID=3775 RepID=A0A1Q3BMU3_CEPFO|nr:hypothetical protein CFOL_v3_12524 [Cephalotus follicularis]